MRKKAKIWYVIADGGRARFVERDADGAYRTVLSFVASELHQRSHDLGLDRPARVKESATPARHAIEPRRDLKEAVKEDFVRRIIGRPSVGQRDAIWLSLSRSRGFVEPEFQPFT